MVSLSMVTNAVEMRKAKSDGYSFSQKGQASLVSHTVFSVVKDTHDTGATGQERHFSPLPHPSVSNDAGT